MVILHIGDVANNPGSGVCVVVPQHVREQGKTENVIGFLNVRKEKIENITNQFLYSDEFDITALPEPFSKPDLAVFHEVYKFDYIKISKQLRKNKIPYIVIPHGSLSNEAQSQKRLKKTVANLFFFNRFINNAIGVQYSSPREYDNSDFGKNRYVLPGGVYIPEKTKETFSEDELKIIYIGRLEPYLKGLDLLLDALKSLYGFLKENRISVSVYGPDHNGRVENLKAMIRERSLEDIVSLYPPVFGEEKEKVLLGADLFIQTSRSEGMPMGVVEALGYGVPVIVTDGNGVYKFVEECGCGWCCKTTSEAIADAICKAVEEKDMIPEKSRIGIKSVNETFSWENVTRNTLEKYKSLISTQTKEI